MKAAVFEENKVPSESDSPVKRILDFIIYFIHTFRYI